MKKTIDDYTKIPSKESLPYTYDKWRRLGILKATPIERLLMLELSGMFGVTDWLFQNDEPTWDIKDMRAWVKEIAPKIQELTK